ncbi:unnamed protein product [Rhizoctonia solani]|uniref:Xylanolytic transcriptional activator regulatory domain-containing protein n=1 Tax=Rhizoctonia solani TaxID=456999 RepID=A0A8H3CEE5_9AGAM|nr:unnamed protein product [Rhizoctonia solani]
MQPSPSVTDVTPRVDRIKDIEARIKMIEQRRGRTSDPSSAYNSSHSESNLSFGTLLSQLPSQATFPNSTPNSSVHKVPNLSSYVASGASPGLNMLMPRGPANLSLPGEASRKLLNMFMQRKLASGFELHMGRVLRSFQPGSSEPAVPALYYSMLLLGCHFISEPELKFWENMFFERTKLEIEANIARAHSNDTSKYNPLHHLQAMVMLGQWFYFKCRLLEGYVYMTRAMQFAVALGLHELDSRIYGCYVVLNRKSSHRGARRWSPRDPVELGEAINLWCQATRFAMTLGIHRLRSRIFREMPTLNMSTGQILVEHWYPEDQRELAEAINIWWKCCGLDMAGSALNGLPASISPEEITTVWPRLLSEYEPGQIIPNDEYSVESLFDPQLYLIVTDSSQDNVKCLLAKACILMISSAKLAMEFPLGSQVPDEWWVRFEQVDRSVHRFMETMPPVYLGQSSEELAYLIIAHSGIYCAQIQLHSTLAEYEIAQAAQDSRQENDFLGGVSYTRCTEACRAAALAAALVLHIDMSNMLLFIGVAWVGVSKVLIRDIPRLRSRGKVVQTREKEHQLAIIEKCMERAATTYPLFSLQLKELLLLKEQQSI